MELTKCYHPTYLWVTCQGFSQKKERLNNAICAGSYVISLMTGNHRKKITFSRGTEETFLSFHILQTSIFNSCPFLRELRFNSNLFFSLYILLYKFCISYLLLSGVTSWFWVGVSQEVVLNRSTRASVSYLKAWLDCRVCFPALCLDCRQLYSMVAGFPQRQSNQESYLSVFNNLILEMTYHPFCHTWYDVGGDNTRM